MMVGGIIAAVVGIILAIMGMNGRESDIGQIVSTGDITSVIAGCALFIVGVLVLAATWLATVVVEAIRDSSS